ncbi:MAG: hypothetical protein Q4G05_05415, partial [Clostridia bacterium]|nr:hypothetical protein [Clostridia bacterium]
THTHTHTVNFKGEERELLKNGRGAEIFSGSNFDVQKSHDCEQSANMSCGQNVETNSHHSPLISHSSGITLIALIITIVIMLILAGITINLTLGENGIFQKAKLAKQEYELATIKEKMELELSALELEHNTSGGTVTPIGLRENVIEESTKGTLVYSSDLTRILGVETKLGVILIDAESESELQGGIRIGDTVNYIPDSAIGFDPDYGEEAGTYTGYVTDTQIITQEELVWKILDISDGKVTLTSEYPTTQDLYLGGWAGICNGVYILNDISKDLYSKSGYAIARSIKYEDVQATTFLTDEETVGGICTSQDTTYKNYPSIFAQQKNTIVDGIRGTVLEKSEQTELILKANAMATFTNKIEIEFCTPITEDTEKRDDNSEEPQIEDLLMKNEKYWIATRSIDSSSRSESNMRYSPIVMRSHGGKKKTSPTGIAMFASYPINHMGYAGAGNAKIKPIVEINENVEFNYNNETLKWDLSI